MFIQFLRLDGRNSNSNKNITLQIKSFLKMISLQVYFKRVNVATFFLRLDGKAFHTVGPAWKKARSPKVFRVTLGITSNVSESDRRLYLVLDLTKLVQINIVPPGRSTF